MGNCLSSSHPALKLASTKGIPHLGLVLSPNSATVMLPENVTAPQLFPGTGHTFMREDIAIFQWKSGTTSTTTYMWSMVDTSRTHELLNVHGWDLPIGSAQKRSAVEVLTRPQCQSLLSGDEVTNQMNSTDPNFVLALRLPDDRFLFISMANMEKYPGMELLKQQCVRTGLSVRRVQNPSLVPGVMFVSACTEGQGDTRRLVRWNPFHQPDSTFPALEEPMAIPSFRLEKNNILFSDSADNMQPDQLELTEESNVDRWTYGATATTDEDSSSTHSSAKTSPALRGTTASSIEAEEVMMLGGDDAFT